MTTGASGLGTVVSTAHGGQSALAVSGDRFLYFLVMPGCQPTTTAKTVSVWVYVDTTEAATCHISVTAGLAPVPTMSPTPLPNRTWQKLSLAIGLVRPNLVYVHCDITGDAPLRAIIDDLAIE